MGEDRVDGGSNNLSTDGAEVVEAIVEGKNLSGAHKGAATG